MSALQSFNFSFFISQTYSVSWKNHIINKEMSQNVRGLNAEELKIDKQHLCLGTDVICSRTSCDLLSFSTAVLFPSVCDHCPGCQHPPMNLKSCPTCQSYHPTTAP